MALPLLLSCYQYVLHASFTAHKTIILELVIILACLYIKIPNQHEGERLALIHFLRRFRHVIDLRNLNSVVVYTDDILLNFQLSDSSSSATG